MYPRIVIAGTQSGVGKTTVSLGLMGALSRQGLQIQPFKVGPDFIDPTHHRAVTSRPSRNLDTWLMNEEVTRELFCRAAEDADLSIIEGVMGLFDGASGIDESGSAAHLAKTLTAPVVLVMDARAMARSAAAVALGFQKLDPNLNMAGIILNRVTTSRHEEYLKDAISTLTGLRVLGALRESDELEMPSRHLGLFAGAENTRIRQAHEHIVKVAERTLDLEGLVEIAKSAPRLEKETVQCFDRPGLSSNTGPVIAYAIDEAFYFYYQDNLDLLAHLGCSLVPFSPLHDALPPHADLLYLGGGYPELYAKQLSDNRPMRDAIREVAMNGGYIYGECGGLMYLCESLVRADGTLFPMCGIVPAQTVMTRRRRSLGYTLVHIDRDCVLGGEGTLTRGHEFHYSTLKLLKDVPAALTITRERGGTDKPDGFVIRNTLASYTHLHFGSNPAVARHLVKAIKPAC
jgi:cobyrinic acid a,c-diamide synthase